MVRHILILGLIAILGILAIPPSGGAQSRGKTLNYILAQEPISMDPHVITETQSGLPVRHVYDRLVEVTPDGRQVVPGLAERWEISRDGLTYTFQLRANARFHSGAPLTAEAVRFSLERVLTLGKGPSFLLKEYVDPKNVRARGPLTVEVRLNKPYFAGAEPLCALRNRVDRQPAGGARQRGLG